VIALFKTDIIARQGPWRRLDAVEYQMLIWVHKANKVRLLSNVSYLPHAVYEAHLEAARAGTAQVPAHP
jgi:putative transposase